MRSLLFGLVLLLTGCYGGFYNPYGYYYSPEVVQQAIQATSVPNVIVSPVITVNGIPNAQTPTTTVTTTTTK